MWEGVLISFIAIVKTIDPRVPTMPGRSTSDVHRRGRYRVHQARSAVGCCASRMEGALHPTKNHLWSRFLPIHLFNAGGKHRYFRQPSHNSYLVALSSHPSVFFFVFTPGLLFCDGEPPLPPPPPCSFFGRKIHVPLYVFRFEW